MFWRGFLVDGDPKPAAENIKKHARVYPLGQATNPPAQRFVNLSGKAFNTIHANDYHFYEEVNELVQAEPNAALDPETLGLLAAIGIEKGKRFAPDARMKNNSPRPPQSLMPRHVQCVSVGTVTRVIPTLRANGLYPNTQKELSNWRPGELGGAS